MYKQTRNTNPAWVAEQQKAIISIQSGVINELFMLLMQHMSMEDVKKLPCVGRINEAASLRIEIEQAADVLAMKESWKQEGRVGRKREIHNRDNRLTHLPFPEQFKKGDIKDDSDYNDEWNL